MSANVWKYNEAGVLQWTAWTGDTARDMVVDGVGNVYVAGHRADSKSVWKYDVDGNEVDSYDTGSSTRGVDIDIDGNIWVAGAEVSSKAVWKLTPDLTLILDIDVDGHAYYLDCSRGFVYIGTAAQGVPKYNLRKHDLAGNEVWKVFVNALSFHTVTKIKAANYIYVCANLGGVGNLSIYDRAGNYMSSVSILTCYYATDIMPLYAIAWDYEMYGWMDYQQVTEDSMIKHQYEEGVVMGAGIRWVTLKGVEFFNTGLTSYLGVCDVYGEFNIMTLTTCPNGYFLVGLARSFGSQEVFYRRKIALPLHPAQACIRGATGWSKNHGTADIMYDTAVDGEGNCYACGEEDTT